MNPQSHFDVLFRNVFDSHSDFNILPDVKIPHPVDIYEHSEGLVLEIACTGLAKEEVDIDVELDVLRVSYDKPKPKEGEEEARIYQCRGVARRSFNLAYKIASKYALAKSEAVMENGLLIVTIPFADEAKPKKLQIK